MKDKKQPFQKLKNYTSTNKNFILVATSMVLLCLITK